MKVLVCGDVHFSSTSSIVRRKGKFFSERLENCIASINYVESCAVGSGCDYIIYLGDFFDKPVLNAEELTALQSIQWSPIKKIFLVGNHEMASSDLSLSSAHLFNLIPNSTVIDSPNGMVGFGCRFMFLPYILESDRKTVEDYFNELFMTPGMFETQETKTTYIFSHNDIKGVQMGNFVSEEGFSVEDIENNCSICFNGHLHNRGYVGSKIKNVGNLTGQNFSEDATKYRHMFDILDTVTGEVKEFVNPFAFNFVKFEIYNQENFSSASQFCNESDNLVVSAKCVDSIVSDLRKFLSECERVCEYRVITILEDEAETNNTFEELVDTDHISEFTKYIRSVLGNNTIVNAELQKVAGQ